MFGLDREKKSERDELTRKKGTFNLITCVGRRGDP